MFARIISSRQCLSTNASSAFLAAHKTARNARRSLQRRFARPRSKVPGGRSEVRYKSVWRGGGGTQALKDDFPRDLHHCRVCLERMPHRPARDLRVKSMSRGRTPGGRDRRLRARSTAPGDASPKTKARRYSAALLRRKKQTEPKSTNSRRTNKGDDGYQRTLGENGATLEQAPRRLSGGTSKHGPHSAHSTHFKNN